MSKLISDAHTALAYRLGESAAPTNTTELARRLSWFSEAINNVCDGEVLFWFQEEIYSTNTVDGQQYYELPSDFRKLKQLKVDGYKYEELPQEEIYKKFESPGSVVPILPAFQARTCYIYDDSIWLIPTPSSAPSAITLATLTGVIATSIATATYTDHTFYSGDYITIAGASDSAYNGTFRVKTVIDDDTFTYETTTTISDTNPTGTITATKNNIIMHYYEYPTEPTSSSSSIVLPDQYMNILVSYAEGRYWSLAQKRAKASDAFTEYESLIDKLSKENFRRKFLAR
jgi:hypothetical protein